MDEVLDEVCRYYDVRDYELKGRRRFKEIVKARHIFSFIANSISKDVYTPYGAYSHSTGSYQMISQYLNQDTHVACMRGAKIIQRRLEWGDNALRKEIEAIAYHSLSEEDREIVYNKIRSVFGKGVKIKRFR